eukprot:4430730-Karenia_brevis.AAC.1
MAQEFDKKVSQAMQPLPGEAPPQEAPSPIANSPPSPAPPPTRLQQQQEEGIKSAEHGPHTTGDIKVKEPLSPSPV